MPPVFGPILEQGHCVTDVESDKNTAIAPDRDPAEDDRWHVQLLGDVAVRRFGERLTEFETTKERLLLGALADRVGHQVSRKWLVEQFWPDSHGDGALRQELTRLKKFLLGTRRRAVTGPTDDPRLDEPYAHAAHHASLRADRVVTDVQEFQKAIAKARAAQAPEAREAAWLRAHAAYGGPFLHGLDEWEWIDQRRAELEREYLTVLRALCEIHEAHEAAEALLAVASEARASDPESEWPCLALMHALLGLGDGPGALKVYEELRNTREEAGLPLSDDARALAARIRSGGAATGAVREPSPHGLGRHEPVHTGPTGTVAFLAARLEQPLDSAEASTDGATVEATDGTGLRADTTGRTDGRTDGRKVARAMLNQLARQLGGTTLTQEDDRLIVCAFHLTVDAMEAAEEFAGSLSGMRHPIVLHAGIHVGDARPNPHGGYVGHVGAQAVAMCRLAAAGQILVSDVARYLAEDSLPYSLWLDHAGRATLPQSEAVHELFTLRSQRTRRSAFPVLGNSNPLAPPRPRDRFFGRTGERTAIRSAFVDEQARLVTLHGTGGIGKTRLALRVAETLADTMNLVARWVDLSAVVNASVLPHTVFEALAGPRTATGDPLAAAIKALEEQPTLLLIDNAEQVVDAVAALVNTLLDAVPTVRILVTSRNVLRLQDEHVFALDPLPVEGVVTGDMGLPYTKSDLAGTSVSDAQTAGEPPSDGTAGQPDAEGAVALFVDRARLAWRGFDADAHMDAITELCVQLEGIPLAIELAAAQANVLSPQQMLSLLADRFQLLDGERDGRPARRDLPERHRSLHAVLDASWSLLPTEARALFAEASVFHGGFTLDALHAVCDQPDPLAHLTTLCDAAMMRAVHGRPQPRYRALETLREYGRERLDEVADEEARIALGVRHAEHFLHLGEEALEEIRPGPVQAQWLRLLDDERDNIRAALDWLDRQSELSKGLRLAGALWRYWFERGQLAEGRGHAERFLRAIDPSDRSAEHALALHGAGTLADYMGHSEDALRFLEQALAIRRELGDSRQAAYTINNLANVAYRLGDYARALPVLEESLEIKRSTGDVLSMTTTLGVIAGICMLLDDKRRFASSVEELLEIAEEGEQPTMIAQAHVLRAMERTHCGDFDRAALLLERATVALDGHGEAFMEPELIQQAGFAAHWAGRLDEAAAHYAAALSRAREVENHGCIVSTLRFQGELAFDRGRLAEAEALLRRALRLARSGGLAFESSGIQKCLAVAYVRSGDPQQARPLLERSLRYRAGIAARVGIAESLEAWAECLAAEGDTALAKDAVLCAHELRARLGCPRPAHQTAAMDRALRAAGLEGARGEEEQAQSGSGDRDDAADRTTVDSSGADAGAGAGMEPHAGAGHVDGRADRAKDAAKSRHAASQKADDPPPDEAWRGVVARVLGG